ERQQGDGAQYVPGVVHHAVFCNLFMKRSLSTPATMPASTAAIRPRRSGRPCPSQAVIAAATIHTATGRVLIRGITTDSSASTAANSSDQEAGMTAARYSPIREQTFHTTHPLPITLRYYQSCSGSPLSRAPP